MMVKLYKPFSDIEAFVRKSDYDIVFSLLTRAEKLLDGRYGAAQGEAARKLRQEILKLQRNES